MDETTPPLSKEGNALLVTQNSSFARSSCVFGGQRKREGFGNGFMTIKEKPVIYHERIFDFGLPLDGFLKIEGNPVKIEKDNGGRNKVERRI